MDQEGENVKQENSEFTVPVEVAGYTITINDNPDKENHEYDNCLFATKKEQAIKCRSIQMMPLPHGREMTVIYTMIYISTVGTYTVSNQMDLNGKK